MIGWLILAVILFIICGCLIVVEILIPSFGLISIASLTCLGGGLYIFHSYGMSIAGVITAAVVVPVTLVIAYRIFPKSRTGKAVMLEAQVREPGQGVPDSDILKGLIGKKGVTISIMRPVGKCEIEGKKYECVAESGYVPKGTEVEVIEVDGSQVTVRNIMKKD